MVRTQPNNKKFRIAAVVVLLLTALHLVISYWTHDAFISPFIPKTTIDQIMRPIRIAMLLEATLFVAALIVFFFFKRYGWVVGLCIAGMLSTQIP